MNISRKSRAYKMRIPLFFLVFFWSLKIFWYIIKQFNSLVDRTMILIYRLEPDFRIGTKSLKDYNRKDYKSLYLSFIYKL